MGGRSNCNTNGTAESLEQALVLQTEGQAGYIYGDRHKRQVTANKAGWDARAANVKQLTRTSSIDYGVWDSIRQTRVIRIKDIKLHMSRRRYQTRTTMPELPDKTETRSAAYRTYKSTHIHWIAFLQTQLRKQDKFSTEHATAIFIRPYKGRHTIAHYP